MAQDHVLRGKEMLTMNNTFKLPDTGVKDCYDRNGKDMLMPKPDEQYYGQNGCFVINPMSYQKLSAAGKPLSDSADWLDGYRMVLDKNTGLM